MHRFASRTFQLGLASVLVSLGCGDDAASTADSTGGSTGAGTSTTSTVSTVSTTDEPAGTTSGSTTDESTTDESTTDGTTTDGTTTDGSTTDGTTTDGTTTDGTTTEDTTGTTGGESDPALVVIGAGRFMHLYDVSSGGIVEVGSAEIPEANVLPGHQIFNIVEQPGENALYVGSSNDCSQGADWCWGNGRIDRFVYDADGITHDSLAYEMNNAAFLADGISCAEGTEVETGYPGQEGNCAVGGLAFSPDGTRFYVDEDEDDLVEIFSVDGGDGSLAFLAEGGETILHGLAAGPEGTYLYNGDRVLDVTGDVVVDVVDSSGGNGTRVVPGDPNRLVTGIDNNIVSVYDLTDPAAPVETASVELLKSANDQGALDLDFTGDLTRFVVGGRNEVRSFSFDGTDFVELDVDIQVGFASRINRAIELTGENDEFAVVAYFRGGNGGKVAPGGVALYDVDAKTGVLTELEDVGLEVPGRAALALSVE